MNGTERAAENARLAEVLFGRKSGRHTHPATHPAWLEFTDGDCIVCETQR